MKTLVLTRSKIIAVALAVIVLIMLFLSWIGISGQGKTAWQLVQKKFEQYEGEIDQYAEYAEAFGLDINYKGAKRALKSIMDGKVSPAEAFSFLGAFKKVYKNVSKLVPSALSAAQTYIKYVTPFRILFILTVLSILLSIFIRLTGKLRKLDFLMFAFILILFVVFVIIASQVSSSFLKVSITAWSVIALICAVPVVLLEKIPFLRPGAAAAGTAVSVKTPWGAKPSIGTSISGIREKAGTLIKNINIGSKKTYQCSVCGHDLQASDKTCPVCRSSASDKMSTAVCKNCGCRIPSGSKYCSFCGSKQN